MKWMVLVFSGSGTLALKALGFRFNALATSLDRPTRKTAPFPVRMSSD